MADRRVCPVHGDAHGLSFCDIDGCDRPTHTDDNPIAATGYPTAPVGYYVMDRMADTCHDAYVAGPFETKAQAWADAREYNIAGDLEVLRFGPLTGWREV